MRGANGANAGNSDGIKGSKNPRWKGGVTFDIRTRQSFQAEIGQWRRRVFHRDEYTCQRCHISPSGRSQLRAHHIAPWALHPALRFTVENGATLCRDCHDWVHGTSNTAREFLK